MAKFYGGEGALGGRHGIFSGGALSEGALTGGHSSGAIERGGALNGKHSGGNIQRGGTPLQRGATAPKCPPLATGLKGDLRFVTVCDRGRGVKNHQK